MSAKHKQGPEFVEKFLHDISAIAKKARCTSHAEWLDPDCTEDNYCYHVSFHNIHANLNYAMDFSKELLDEMSVNDVVYQAVMRRLEEEVLNSMDLNKRLDLFTENLDKEVSSLTTLAKQYGIFCFSNKSISIKFYEDKIELHFTKQLPNSQN